MLHQPMHDFPPTRAAALERLIAYAPKAGRAYASGRNADPGPGKPQAVSMLSPYLRRRMITEREVVAEVLKHHSPEAAEKFIQEVFWRAYFKGWLEMRPGVWDRYLTAREHGLRDLDKDGALRRDYHAAITGETGIEGFDDWARELVETGWLHNHARMWFASIWIFTLRLPWALGADFFYRHLMDADPASNTLSWRWVGGLHTRGKTYLARADNIEKYTDGRFRPTDLAAFAEPLVEDNEHPAPLPPPQGHPRVPDGDYALLLTTDDLHPESWPGFESNRPKLVISVGQVPLEASLNTGDKGSAFTRAALGDAVTRLGVDHTAMDADWNLIAEAVGAEGLNCLALPMPMAGPSQAFVATKNGTSALSSASSAPLSGLQLHPVQRAWDEHAFPRATAGFFKLKKAIPKLLARADLV